jgi:hypothetical protein
VNAPKLHEWMIEEREYRRQEERRGRTSDVLRLIRGQPS